MTQTLCILGRQPALGIVELESLCGPDKLRPVGTSAALVDIDPIQIDFSRLGGTVKFCKVLAVLDTTNWRDIQTFLESAVPQHIVTLPEGKMRLGLSAYGLTVTPQRITATGLTLKKIIRKNGRSVRLIPNNELALNSAQVIYNKLTSSLGWELIFVRDGAQTICAQSIAVQDITAYTKRDRGRPKRDARVGMLPPKLAQIIVNVATGPMEPVPVLAHMTDCPPSSLKDRSILDPFCGTGVILQEAILMGYGVYGTDIQPRMIEYTQTNLEWFTQEFSVADPQPQLEIADATTHHWTQHFDTVASETYLGHPFTDKPDKSTLADTVKTCNLILRKFLINIATQIPAGTRLCLAIPAWQVQESIFQHLPLLDHIEDMGYNRLSFAHARVEDLVYFRPNQFVARELLVITRK